MATEQLITVVSNYQSFVAQLSDIFSASPPADKMISAKIMNALLNQLLGFRASLIFTASGTQPQTPTGGSVQIIDGLEILIPPVGWSLVVPDATPTMPNIYASSILSYDEISLVITWKTPQQWFGNVDAIARRIANSDFNNFTVANNVVTFTSPDGTNTKSFTLLSGDGSFVDIDGTNVPKVNFSSGTNIGQSLMTLGQEPVDPNDYRSVSISTNLPSFALHSSSNTYKQNDIVSDSNSLYRAIQNVPTNTLLTNNSFWFKLTSSPTQANIYPPVKQILKSGTNVTITPDDANSILTINVTIPPAVTPNLQQVTTVGAISSNIIESPIKIPDSDNLSIPSVDSIVKRDTAPTGTKLIAFESSNTASLIDIPVGSIENLDQVLGAGNTSNRNIDAPLLLTGSKTVTIPTIASLIKADTAPTNTKIVSFQSSNTASLIDTDLANGVPLLDDNAKIKVVELPIATTTSIGGISVGTGLAVTGAGVLSATGTSFTPTQANIYPPAKQIIKAGTNATVTPDDANSTLTIGFTPPVVATPSLQQVTTVGATTTDKIIASGGVEFATIGGITKLDTAPTSTKYIGFSANQNTASLFDPPVVTTPTLDQVLTRGNTSAQNIDAPLLLSGTKTITIPTIESLKKADTAPETTQLLSFQSSNTASLIGTDVANGVPLLDANTKIKVDELPIATTTSLGGVKPNGTNITIDANGVISANVATFTPTQANIYPPAKQILQAGTNITITPSDANNTLTINASGGAVIPIDNQTLVNRNNVDSINPDILKYTTAGTYTVDLSGFISITSSVPQLTQNYTLINPINSNAVNFNASQGSLTTSTSSNSFSGVDVGYLRQGDAIFISGVFVGIVNTISSGTGTFYENAKSTNTSSSFSVYRGNVAGIGTISVAFGSASVTGVGTTFTNYEVGDIIADDNNVFIGFIQSINSNTSITLTANSNSTIVGVTFTVYKGYELVLLPVYTPVASDIGKMFIGSDGGSGVFFGAIKQIYSSPNIISIKANKILQNLNTIQAFINTFTTQSITNQASTPEQYTDFVTGKVLSQLFQSLGLNVLSVNLSHLGNFSITLSSNVSTLPNVLWLQQSLIASTSFPNGLTTASSNTPIALSDNTATSGSVLRNGDIGQTLVSQSTKINDNNSLNFTSKNLKGDTLSETTVKQFITADLINYGADVTAGTSANSLTFQGQNNLNLRSLLGDFNLYHGGFKAISVSNQSILSNVAITGFPTPSTSDNVQYFKENNGRELLWNTSNNTVYINSAVNSTVFEPISAINEGIPNGYTLLGASSIISSDTSNYKGAIFAFGSSGNWIFKLMNGNQVLTQSSSIVINDPTRGYISSVSNVFCYFEQSQYHVVMSGITWSSSTIKNIYALVTLDNSLNFVSVTYSTVSNLTFVGNVVVSYLSNSQGQRRTYCVSGQSGDMKEISTGTAVSVLPTGTFDIDELNMSTDGTIVYFSNGDGHYGSYNVSTGQSITRPIPSGVIDGIGCVPANGDNTTFWAMEVTATGVVKYTDGFSLFTNLYGRSYADRFQPAILLDTSGNEGVSGQLLQKTSTGQQWANPPTLNIARALVSSDTALSNFGNVTSGITSDTDFPLSNLGITLSSGVFTIPAGSYLINLSGTVYIGNNSATVCYLSLGTTTGIVAQDVTNTVMVASPKPTGNGVSDPTSFDKTKLFKFTTSVSIRLSFFVNISATLKAGSEITFTKIA